MIISSGKIPQGFNYYRYSECKNILAGTAIEAFGLYMDELKDKKEITAFAEKHLNNRRSATEKKAEILLLKI